MSKSLRVPKRRRRENKTDYASRIILLKSNAVRIVVRKTDRYIIMQAVETTEAKDKILTGITSKELLNHGWDSKFAGSLKSVPAAYLTGMLMAKTVPNELKKRFILDTGMVRNIQGSRIYAAAKGLVDGGLNISLGENAVPSKDRLDGKHLSKEVQETIAKVKLNLSKK